jgi:hypothetical protein
MSMTNKGLWITVLPDPLRESTRNNRFDRPGFSDPIILADKEP